MNFHLPLQKACLHALTSTNAHSRRLCNAKLIEARLVTYSTHIVSMDRIRARFTAEAECNREWVEILTARDGIHEK